MIMKFRQITIIETTGKTETEVETETYINVKALMIFLNHLVSILKKIEVKKNAEISLQKTTIQSQLLSLVVNSLLHVGEVFGILDSSEHFESVE